MDDESIIRRIRSAGSKSKGPKKPLIYLIGEELANTNAQLFRVKTLMKQFLRHIGTDKFNFRNASLPKQINAVQFSWEVVVPRYIQSSNVELPEDAGLILVVIQDLLKRHTKTD